MTFSQSFDLGNSTLMKLESEVNHIINDENPKTNRALEVILESPTSKSRDKSSALSVTRARSRFLQAAPQINKTKDSTNHGKFRRSKSDSTLSKHTSQDKKSQAQDNYTQFFQSNFSFQQHSTKAEQNSIQNGDEPVLRVSQIEAVFKDVCDSDVDNPEITEVNNSFEKPIFSEDLLGVLENEKDDSIWKVTLSATSKNEVTIDEPPEIPQELSSFICLPDNNDILRSQLLKKELALSHKTLKAFQHSEENVSDLNVSLSCMSPDQLKFTQEISPVLNCSNTYVKPTQEIHSVSNIGNKRVEEMFKAKSTDNLEALKSIKAWNLPLSILTEYERKGVKTLFDWQIQCLSNPKVFFEHCNLVYSAPTSAGKTLVSEILLLKTVIERGKKVLLILPFISVVREKMFYLQDLLTSAGYRVEGFFGGYTPPGGFESINVAICTIEKANSIINKLLEQGKINEIGTVIVDEVHLISDPGRGYILELLLAKLLFMSRKHGLQIQIITMSATLTNVELLKRWLDAEMYITDFRPIALQEMIKIGNKIYDNGLNVLRSVAEKLGNVKEPFPKLKNDSDHIAELCIETLVNGCSVIVFCPSKDWCENLATQLAEAIHLLGRQGGEWGSILRAHINNEAINNVKQQLRDIPTGLDAVLGKCITYGCSFHHAGLTTEERDIVEASFKSGVLKIIVATSTLSSGVNLPARRVIIRSPLFGGKQMSSLTYRQMIGRAGRMGKDILGESILICTESNARVGKELISAELRPITSCLELDSCTHLKRALLEVISSGIAISKSDIENFVNCTLLSAQKQKSLQDQHESINRQFISEALEFLIQYEFIRLQTKEETQEEYYVATRLGNACLDASMPPSDGLILFAELQKSRRCFVLESELHAIYLVTPYSVCYQLQDLDWLLFLDLWEKLTPAMKKVGELVGVKESFLVRAMRGQTKLDYKLMQIHKRFYTALALQELVNEKPINEVAIKYKCTRGMLQSLQQISSTFAGIVTSFCNSLRWNTLALIVSQFKERLYFGIHQDLIDLMRLPDLNHKRARVLFDAGVTSLIELATADNLYIEKLLFNALSFDSEKKQDHENEYEAAKRNEARNFFITGKVGVTVAEAAKLLIQEARKFVQYEIGVGGIKWSQTNSDENGKINNNKNEIHMSCDENKYKDFTLDRGIENSENKENICHQSYSDVRKPIEGNDSDVSINTVNCKKLRNIDKEHLGDYKEINKIFVANPTVLENGKKFVNNRNTSKKGNEKIHQKEKAQSVTKKRISSENLRENLPKMDKTTSNKDTGEMESKIKPINDLEVPLPISADDVNQASTSKKAQKLLKAKQLSEMKKQEWAKRSGLQQNQLVHLVNTRTNIKEKSKISNTVDNGDKTGSVIIKEKPETLDTVDKNIKMLGQSNENCILQANNSSNTPKPSISNGKSEITKLPRRSPRNHAKSPNGKEKQIKIYAKSPKNNNNNILENEESFKINTGILEALMEADNVHKITITGYKNNSPGEEDEIPSSQQLIDEVSTNITKSPHSSRFLRSLRYTQKIQCSKIKPLAEATKLEKSNTKDNLELESLSNTNIEFSDLLMENSLIQNAIQLNASHILSCSEVDADSSSFKSLDIIDICGNQQLFKEAFKEFMLNKRLGFCLGIEQQCEKRKPLIGANLLLNQVAASERKITQTKSYEFQMNDVHYLAGIGFCISENVVYYMNMQQEGSCKEITTETKRKYLFMLLHSKEHTLLVYDAKEQMKILLNVFKDNEEILVGLEDPKVANWLLQPDKNHNLHNLAQQFAPECSSLVDLCGSGRGYNSYGLDSDSAILAKIRSSIEACVTTHILKGQIENLERIGTGQLYKFFTELEMPLQMSLSNMEHLGFPTSSVTLQKLFQQVINTMKKLEIKIYEKHGSRFNLGSSSAVARVLGLHRKSNGRISTSKQILDKIDSPIAQMIITYRKLNVILTKNVQPLMKTVMDDRIHGQSMCFTSTGRISMTEPNLQNVAKDFEVDIDLEKITISCRSAFFPANTKRCLISSDFCQLEMRILAHLSQDPSLLQVMKIEKDIFVAIAAQWNKILEHNVTEQLRNGTKQICYGIVYGMGMRALAESLKCTEAEAKFLSEQFHATYPGIRSYIEKILKFARNNGYIETITGRRRYLENINSEEASIKNQAERQAVNSTIQGSAADIAKSAILRMEKNIEKYRKKLGIEANSVRLVLHLHDELIFEVPEEKAKKIAKVLSLTMENCVKLNVPLRVKLKIGKSWGELQELKL